MLLHRGGASAFRWTLTLTFLDFDLDPDWHPRAVAVLAGAFDDLPSVARALAGVYGAWVNTDGFTVGEAKEVWAGIRIFELAKQDGGVRHYVWSSLDYASKVSP